jgi:Na+/H+ antiporter NhaD/arsenite permease-like protein
VRNERSSAPISLPPLAGNFTVLGSIANLIVVQRAAASGVEISFWAYFRVGAPLTLITIAIGTLWLWLWL